MKNLSLVLNVVLLVAVGVLYFLHFSGNTETTVAPVTGPAKNASIVFVNSDSMLNQYTYFKNKKAEMEEKQEKVQNSLKAESQRLQNEVMEYQKNAITMSGQQRQQIEEELTMKQQQFLQKKDNQVSQLENEQDKNNDELYVRLNAFLKEFTKQNNYSFILGYKRGGSVLSANDNLDITKDVVAGLNKAYEEGEKK